MLFKAVDERMKRRADDDMEIRGRSDRWHTEVHTLEMPAHGHVAYVDVIFQFEITAAKVVSGHELT